MLLSKEIIWQQCETQYSTTEVEYTWKITHSEHVLLLTKNKMALRSPSFKVNDECFLLELYPNGCSKESSEFSALQLVRMSSEKKPLNSMDISLQVSLLCDQQIAGTEEPFIYHYTVSQEKNTLQFLGQHKVALRKDLFPPHGKTLEFSVRIKMQSSLSTKYVLPKEAPLSFPKKAELPYLNTGVPYDAFLVVKSLDTVIKMGCHQFMLQLRAPYFYNSHIGNAKENKECVELNLDKYPAHIYEDFIFFIYHGATLEPTPENYKDLCLLLSLAHDIQLEGLKIITEQMLTSLLLNHPKFPMDIKANLEKLSDLLEKYPNENGGLKKICLHFMNEYLKFALEHSIPLETSPPLPLLTAPSSSTSKAALTLEMEDEGLQSHQSSSSQSKSPSKALILSHSKDQITQISTLKTLEGHYTWTIKNKNHILLMANKGGQYVCPDTQGKNLKVGEYEFSLVLYPYGMEENTESQFMSIACLTTEPAMNAEIVCDLRFSCKNGLANATWIGIKFNRVDFSAKIEEFALREEIFSTPEDLVIDFDIKIHSLNNIGFFLKTTPFVFKDDFDLPIPDFEIRWDEKQGGRCHQYKLRVTTEYFNNLLSHPVLETQNKYCTLPFSKRAIELFLNFVYNHQLLFKSWNECYEVLELAFYLQCDRLISRCDKMLATNLFDIEKTPDTILMQISESKKLSEKHSNDPTHKLVILEEAVKKAERYFAQHPDLIQTYLPSNPLSSSSSSSIDLGSKREREEEKEEKYPSKQEESRKRRK